PLRGIEAAGTPILWMELLAEEAPLLQSGQGPGDVAGMNIEAGEQAVLGDARLPAYPDEVHVLAAVQPEGRQLFVQIPLVLSVKDGTPPDKLHFSFLSAVRAEHSGSPSREFDNIIAKNICARNYKIARA